MSETRVVVRIRPPHHWQALLRLSFASEKSTEAHSIQTQFPRLRQCQIRHPFREWEKEGMCGDGAVWLRMGGASFRVPNPQKVVVEKVSLYCCTQD